MKWMDDWQEMRLSALGDRRRVRSKRPDYCVYVGVRLSLWPWCVIGMLAVVLGAVLGWFLWGAS